MDNRIKIDLDKKLEKYLDKIMYIDMVYDIFFSMKYGDVRWNDLYGTSPAYFAVVRESLGYYFVLGLCNFFETDKRSDLNISRFILDVIKVFEKYESQIPVEVITFKDFIDTKQDLIKKLMIHRDKNIAHFDKKYFLDVSSLENDAPLYPAEIKELIDNTLHFIGNLNYIISGYISYAEFHNKKDYERLFLLYNKSQTRITSE